MPDALPPLARCSRRRFLRLCRLASLSGLLAACGDVQTATPVPARVAAAPPPATPELTPTSEPATNPADAARAAPAPRSSIFDFTCEPNYPSAEYDTFGYTTNGSAGVDGVLHAHVHAKLQSKQAGAGGWVRSWVKWVHTQPAGIDDDYTVALDFDWLRYPQATLSGYATAVTLIGATITDRETGETLTLLIERIGYLLAFVPLKWGSWEYQPVCTRLIGGHTYDIVAYLKVSASVYSDTGGDVGASRLAASGGGYGEVEELAEIRIKGMALMLKDPPWVRVLVRSFWTPTHDTYTLYQRALKRATGHDYFASAIMLDISAGGRYEPSRSWITLTVPDDDMLTPRYCPFQHTISNQTLRMDLAPCDDRAMKGRDWSFAATIDPKFSRRVDPFEDEDEDEMPLLEPTLGILWDVDLAAIQDLEKAAARPKSPGLASYAQLTPSPNVQSPLEFYDIANWCYILPADGFAALTAPAGGAASGRLRERRLATPPPLADLELEANSNLAKLLGGTLLPREGSFRPLSVGLHLPRGAARPALDAYGLEIHAVDQLAFQNPDHPLRGQPVVTVSVLEIWNAFIEMTHPLLDSQGLEWSANPRFIQWLIRLGESAEYHRTRLENLHYMTRSGVAVRVTDLPEYWSDQADEILSAPLAVDQADESIPLPVLVFLVRHRRARRFVRRLLSVQRLLNWYAQIRPRQAHKIDLYGHVGRGSMISEDRCEAQHDVLFDLVPRTQPWPLAEPIY